MSIAKIYRTPLAALICAALLLSGCKKTADQPVAPPPPEVGVVTLQTQKVTLTSELPGRTAPCQIAEVRPQISGIVQKRLFTEGREVKAGQLLYQIDPASSRAALASARANLARSEANLSPVRLKATRFADLLTSHAVSQQDNEAAQAELKQAEAEVAAAQATLQSATINLDFTSIVAPISGRIGRSSVTVGALVTSNQDASLATIQQLDPIYVDVTRSSSEMLQLKQQLASGALQTDAAGAARVKLFLEDGTPYAHPGTLKFSEVSVDPSTGSVSLRTLFPNPEQLLLPGMFVRALLEEGVNSEGLLVPQRGVTRDPSGGAMVMAVNAEEKVEVRMIKVVRTVGDSWLVAEGLQAGDRVIVEGLQKARPGTVVKALPFGAPAVAPPVPSQPAAAGK